MSLIPKHTRKLKLASCIIVALALLAPAAQSQEPQTTTSSTTGPAIIPARSAGEGVQYERLVIRNVNIFDGTGAPLQGAFDVAIEKDRIAEIRGIGEPRAINAERRLPRAEHEIDGTGYTLLPGFIDTHVHLHAITDSQKVPSEYILKLWLGHGVTSVRDVGSGRPIEWLVDVKKRSERNEIVAPRIDIYPACRAIQPDITTAEKAREAIRNAKRRGADGIKFGGCGNGEDILFAALDEAEKIGLKTTMHHAQQSVVYANVVTTSAHGLDSMEHWYGLPEAMFTDRKVQEWPVDFVNDDEQQRFGEAGNLWKQAAAPGSEKWNEVMGTLLERNFQLSPTLGIYIASRDLQRSMTDPWHAQYTHPGLWDFFRPSRFNHGAYWFDWTTEREVAWKDNYKLWMQFVNEYKNKGGVVSVGTDAGYIYSTYGFSYVKELELLREAGFSSLEALRAATGEGAKVLGYADRLGNVRVGYKADLVLVKGNPVANLKLLYGTGTYKLNDDTGKVEKIGGVDYTIKDGYVYDARKLREDVRQMVLEAKQARGLPDGYMPIENAN